MAMLKLRPALYLSSCLVAGLKERSVPMERKLFPVTPEKFNEKFSAKLMPAVIPAQSFEYCSSTYLLSKSQSHLNIITKQLHYYMYGIEVPVTSQMKKYTSMNSISPGFENAMSYR